MVRWDRTSAGVLWTRVVHLNRRLPVVRKQGGNQTGGYPFSPRGHVSRAVQEKVCLAGASQCACGSATAICAPRPGSPVNPRLLRPEVGLLTPPQCFRVQLKSDNICESTSTLGCSIGDAQAGRGHPATGRLLLQSSLTPWLRGVGEVLLRQQCLLEGKHYVIASQESGASDVSI